MDQECIFCAIVADRDRTEIIAENGASLAFLDAYPINPGHVLVIPKIHARDIFEMDSAGAESLFLLGHRVAATLKESGIPAEGINFVMSNGAVAEQSVFHAHLHVIPRVTGDGFGFREGAPAPNTAIDLSMVAGLLRTAGDRINPRG